MEEKDRRKKNTKKQTKKIPEDNNEMDKTKKYQIKRKKHPKVKKVILIIFLILLISMIIGAGVAVGILYGICKDAKLDMKELVISNENSVVLDINGDVIAELSGDENRENITISEMSKYIPKAFVAIEDERFYDHNGVDLKRTGAATLTYVLNRGNSSFGGSTITQQLIKNITDEDDRTWQRKVKEMARAYYLEQEMSKSQILELYLNLIFLGDRAYGVEVASNYYFNKSASELSIAESAFLAGINNSPNAYDPFSTEQDDIDQIKRRTKIVVDKMHQLGQEKPSHKAAITEEEYKTAIAEIDNGLAFNKGTIFQGSYTYHTEAAITQVKNDLKEKNGWTDEYVDYYVKSGGLTIYTTQNTNIQNIMQEEVKKDKYIEYSRKTKDENGNYVTAQTAMVLMDHKTGYVLACVGGIGEKTTTFGLNRATQSPRQPGSSIKPIAVLCPGINAGIITAASVFDDINYSQGKFSKYGDYAGQYKGLVTVRYAIATSQNIPMVKALDEIGIDRSVEYLSSINMPVIEIHRNLSLALGVAEMTPLQMTAAYATIANDGVYIEPTFYTKVVDSNGNVVLEAEQETKTVLSTATAYIVKEILSEVVRSGNGSYAGLSGISVGVKTGTSNDNIDRWFCGFTPYYTAATWFGYDINETVLSQSWNPAGYIWDGVMEPIHQGLPAAKFSDTRPSNVTTATICRSSGKLATDACRNDPRGNQVYTEYFIKGTVPTESCTTHVMVDICEDTGLVANEHCPNKVSKSFITRPSSETGNWQWASDAKYMLPSETCTIHTTPTVAPEPPTTTEPGNNGETNNTEEPEEPEKPEEPEQPGNTTGGGNNTSGGNSAGGNNTGGNSAGGNNTGGNSTGGNNTEENSAGGNNTGGNSTEEHRL